MDKAESLVRALNGELNDKMIEIYSLSMQLFMLQQKYPEAFQCTQRRTALSRAVHGDDSEITLTFFEEEVLFARDLQQYDYALPMMQSLIHTLVQVNGSENNQKVFQCYEHLFSMFFQTHDYNQALVTQQKRISIFKELNGGNLED